MLPESRYPDAFYLHAEDDDHSVGIRKASSLLAKLGIRGDKVICIKSILPCADDDPADNLCVTPNTITGTGLGHHWPRPALPVSTISCCDDGNDMPPVFRLMRVEDIYALAYKLEDSSQTPWAMLEPRSFSVLPIAAACQANCAFCFSKSSISSEISHSPLSLSRVSETALAAKRRGAGRAVITGGGEPGLMPHERLTELIRLLSEIFGRVVLITNAFHLSRCDESRRLQIIGDYARAGLSVLAVSRHASTRARNDEIMGVQTDAEAVFASSALAAPEIRRRLICVLQQGAVDSAIAIDEYIEAAATMKADEICFKELYVSTSIESSYASAQENEWCEKHRVPLDHVVTHLEHRGSKTVARLPWGSPVFETAANDRMLRIAAYTEPSVGWERWHRIARSWNLVADGRCFASLEDADSEVCCTGCSDVASAGITLQPASIQARAFSIVQVQGGS